MKSRLTYYQGFYFPLHFLVVGFVCLGLGISLLFSGSYAWAIGLSLVGSFLLFNAAGTEIDPEGQRIRVYQRFFGFPFGKWEPLTKYPDVLVLTAKASKDKITLATVVEVIFILTASLIPSWVQPEFRKEYEVCFANHNHFQQIFVKKFREKDQALRFAEVLASQTGTELVMYNPGKKKPRTKLRSY
ncbi:MAG: hypothetical protein AAF206_01175 [Bacteroidota bacterium]